MIKRSSSSSHSGEIVASCLETVTTSSLAWQTWWAWKRDPRLAFASSHFILTRFQSNRFLFTRSLPNAMVLVNRCVHWVVYLSYVVISLWKVFHEPGLWVTTSRDVRSTKWSTFTIIFMHGYDLTVVRNCILSDLILALYFRASVRHSIWIALWQPTILPEKHGPYMLPWRSMLQISWYDLEIWLFILFWNTFRLSCD